MILSAVEGYFHKKNKVSTAAAVKRCSTEVYLLKWEVKLTTLRSIYSLPPTFFGPRAGVNKQLHQSTSPPCVAFPTRDDPVWKTTVPPGVSGAKWGSPAWPGCVLCVSPDARLTAALTLHRWLHHLPGLIFNSAATGSHGNILFCLTTEMFSFKKTL